MALVMMSSTTAGLASAALSTTETPSDDSMPGLGSFIVFVFLAVALYFLLKNMNARLRRMSYREKERAAAEADAAEAGPGADPPASGPERSGQPDLTLRREPDEP
jgi:large-conductance mechanosensitive channel